MPVENAGSFFPQADVQFEAPDGPQTVEFDDGTGHAGEADEVESPVTVDHSELHEPSSTDQFAMPTEPVVVAQPGYEPAAAPAGQPADAAPSDQPPGPPAQDDGAGDAVIALQEAAADAAAEQGALQEASDQLAAAVQADKTPAQPPPSDGKTPGGAQAKVVTPPVGQPAAGTDGAQTK